MKEVEGLRQGAGRREGPKPPLAALGEAGAVEMRERAVHLRLKRVVPAAHHEPVRLVREELAAQSELRGVPGGGQQAREQDTIRGVGVEPPLLETFDALTVYGHRDH